MNIVTTGVHNTGHLGSIRNFVGLLNRQGIHIGAQCHHRPGAMALQVGNHSVASNTGSKRYVQISESLLNKSRRLNLFKGEFRVLV